MAVPSSPPAPGKTGSVDLNTLVAAIQNAVQAQNLIATKIDDLNTTLAAAFPPPTTATATWDPSSIAAGASATTTVSVTGAALGQFVKASFSLDLQGLTLTAYVSSANTVTALLANNTAGAVDLGSGTLKVSVTS